jgi:hypothetical protein
MGSLKWCSMPRGPERDKAKAEWIEARTKRRAEKRAPQEAKQEAARLAALGVVEINGSLIGQSKVVHTYNNRLVAELAAQTDLPQIKYPITEKEGVIFIGDTKLYDHSTECLKRVIEHCDLMAWLKDSPKRTQYTPPAEESPSAGTTDNQGEDWSWL